MELSICELIKTAAETEKGITYIDSENYEAFCSYKNLLKNSYDLLGGMCEKGLKKGDQVIFQFSDNKAFIECFWSCILGGMIPVPIPACIDKEKINRLMNVLDILEKPIIACDSLALNLISVPLREKNISGVTIINTSILTGIFKVKNEGAGKDQDITMIQFSSGSTGQPKGVQLTHQNIITNVYSIVEGAGFSKNDSVLSWLPITHDMGLIGAHITAVMLGVNQYIISTRLFLQKPTIWFEKMSEHKVTVTLAPNFAYKYILSILKSGQKFNWQLDNIHYILNGAEPISADVCHAFMQEMKCFGLKEDTLLNVYGMAEASLAVSFSTPHEKIKYSYFDRRTLTIGKQIKVSERKENSVPIVNVGKAVPCCSIRIADENNKILTENTVGEIQLLGKHITPGYYKGGEINLQMFTPDGWLHTGDIGFFYEQKLYISGRYKEILFVNGQNYYPYDIEETAEKIMMLSPGSTAVCGIYDELLERDKIYLFVECADCKPNEDFVSHLKEGLMQNIGIYIDAVIPIDNIPKTESGKLQRVRLKKMIVEGKFDEILSIKTKKYEETLTQHLSQTEKRLIEICIELIDGNGSVSININTSFMEIGLDSVKLVSFAEKISKDFLKKISITDVFSHPTILEMSKYLDEEMVEIMPEVKLSDFHKLKQNGNNSGYVYFEIDVCTVDLIEHIQEIFSTSLFNLHPEGNYSYHSMCTFKDCLEYYMYIDNNIGRSGYINSEKIFTAKRENTDAFQFLIFDRELNNANQIMKQEYDIIVEYSVWNDKIEFYCYRSDYADDKLLILEVNELINTINNYAKEKLKHV